MVFAGVVPFFIFLPLGPAKKSDLRFKAVGPSDKSLRKATQG